MSVLLATVVVLALSAVALWRHGARNICAGLSAPAKGRHHNPDTKPRVMLRSGNRVAFTDTHPKEIAA